MSNSKVLSSISHQALLRCVRVALTALICSGSFLSACSSIPAESVELSAMVGRDIGALKQSYDLLIKDKFDGFRAERNVYLENEWIPAFVERWVENGRLIEVAEGSVVFDESSQAFVSPTPGREQQELLRTVLLWSEAALALIAEKREEIIGPLDSEEKRVRAEAAAAFDRVIQANAVVTAHLNSIRNVKEFQSTVLAQIGVKDVIEDLNRKLIDLSEGAAESLSEIRKLDGLVDESRGLVNQFSETT